MHQENFGIGFTLICSEQQISAYQSPVLPTLLIKERVIAFIVK